MTISVMGVLMIVATVAILAYLGFQSISSFISADASSNNANEQLAALQSEYSSLKTQYDNLKVQVQATSDTQLKADYNDAELELVKTQSAINDVSSAISVGKPSAEVNSRIQTAQQQMQTANSALANLKSEM